MGAGEVNNQYNYHLKLKPSIQYLIVTFTEKNKAVPLRNGFIKIQTY
jgi:hypothetical protein